MWVEFVVGSLSCSERFFSGYSSFPLSSKTNTLNFQFDVERTEKFKRVLKNPSKCSEGKQNYNYKLNIQLTSYKQDEEELVHQLS